MEKRVKYFNNKKSVIDNKKSVIDKIKQKYVAIYFFISRFFVRFIL